MRNATLVYFAPVAWDSYLQRPHYTVLHFLNERGRRVVWVDPYPTRFPTLRDFGPARTLNALTTPRPEGLTVVKPRALPFEPLSVGRRCNRVLFGERWLRRVRANADGAPIIVGIGRPSSLARAALDVLEPVWSFYDAMDDFAEFYTGLARRATGAVDLEIASAVGLILVPSSSLLRRFEAITTPRLRMANACDMEALPPPHRAAGAAPVLGYIGCISRWFDWSVVIDLAERVPEARIELVGPCHEAPGRTLPPNVVLRPACPHVEAVERLRTFTVGLIPFKRSQLTEGVDPIKYYEYRGMGLPVLTTRFGEMATRTAEDGVHFVDAPDGLAAALAASAVAGDVDARIVRIMEFRAQHSWARRFAEARLFEDLPG